MAITIIEQLNILKGNISPVNVTFEELVKQAATDEATSMFNTLKIVDPASLSAFGYREKIEAALVQIIQTTRTDLITNLSKTLVSLYTGTYATVETATDVQWETFVVSNILEAIEIVAGIHSQEKIDYDSYKDNMRVS